MIDAKGNGNPVKVHMEGHLAWCAGERRFDAKTVRAYRADLGQLAV